MNSALTERMVNRANFKHDFVDDMAAEGLAERDLALVLDCANSQAHGLCSIDSPKNLAAADIVSLPEGLGVRTLRKLLARLTSRYELVLVADDDLSAASEEEAFAEMAKEYGEAAVAWASRMGKDLTEEQYEERDRELSEAEQAIARARRLLASRRSKQPTNVRDEHVGKASGKESAIGLRKVVTGTIAQSKAAGGVK